MAANQHRLTDLSAGTDDPAELAELRASNERLESFAYVASHDLRSPLRAILSLVEWIRDDLEDTYGNVPDSVNDDLSELQGQGRRMDKLLTDLLEYARIGTEPSVCDAVQANVLVQDCIKITSAPEEFEITMDEVMPCVKCNPVEFAIIVRNLLSNAIKHHDRGMGSIHVGAWRDGDMAHFRVRDDGPGVPPEYAEEVFQMFRTLDSTRGSGIGLGMVLKIVNSYGGTVAVTANPDGRGSDFTFTLPLAVCPDLSLLWDADEGEGS